MAPAAAPADQRQRNVMPITREVAAAGNGCWKWSHVGVCSYGDNCRFPHLGTAGAQRHTVADEDGNCLMLKKGTCSRNNCPFLHGSAAAAEDQQPDPPAANTTQAAADIKHRGRTQFAVLHDEKATRRASRVHPVGNSTGFVAPGTSIAAGNLKPRWVKDTPQDSSSDCEDY